MKTHEVIRTKVGLQNAMEDMVDRLHRKRFSSLLIISDLGHATALARRLAAQVPSPSGKDEESLAFRYEQAGLTRKPKVPPFRAPHYTVSQAAMLGKAGKRGHINLGELALANAGTLFLDEVTEFRFSIIDRTLKAIQEGEVDFFIEELDALVRVLSRPHLLIASMWGQELAMKTAKKRLDDIMGLIGFDAIWELEGAALNKTGAVSAVLDDWPTWP